MVVAITAGIRCVLSYVSQVISKQSYVFDTLNSTAVLLLCTGEQFEIFARIFPQPHQFTQPINWVWLRLVSMRIPAAGPPVFLVLNHVDNIFESCPGHPYLTRVSLKAAPHTKNHTLGIRRAVGPRVMVFDARDRSSEIEHSLCTHD